MAELNTSKIYDLYASLLNYKKQIGDLKLARSYNWIPDEHLRRLQAYELLTAFYQNYSRDFRMAPEAGDEGNNDDIMESGDAAWLCNKIKAKLLGGNPKLSMPGPKTLRQIKAIEAEVKNGDSARAGSGRTYQRESRVFGGSIGDTS